MTDQSPPTNPWDSKILEKNMDKLKHKMSLSFCQYLDSFPSEHTLAENTGKHPPATGKKTRPLKDWKLLKTFWFISGDVLSQFPEEVRSAESTEGLTTYSGNGWGVFTEIYLIILWINCRSNGPLDLTVEGQPVGYFCHTVGFGMLHADQCRRWRSQNNPENETKVHQTDWHLLVSSSPGVNR